MPIYEFVCEACGRLAEVMQKVDDPPPAKCDECGAEGRMAKIMSRSSFQLKGGGWYSDLYSSSTPRDAKGEGKKDETKKEAPKADAKKETPKADVKKE